MFLNLVNFIGICKFKDVSGFGFRVSGFEFCVSGFEFRVLSFEFRVFGKAVNIY